MNTLEFKYFPKIARLSRECVITEKIDGTNAQIYITDAGDIFVGSRNKWITPTSDNYGFAGWVSRNHDEIIKLGPGQHFGEWWGSGIQRAYGLKNNDKRFSLFNTYRWTLETAPVCCHVVPILYKGEFCTYEVEAALQFLKEQGSLACPGFMNPEGIIIYHTASKTYFKKTIENDESPKST